MRTTLTIEPHIAERIRKRMDHGDETLKGVINEALRLGLRALEAEAEMSASGRNTKFVVKPHSFGLRPGIDPERLSQFADELEDEETVAKLRAT